MAAYQSALKQIHRLHETLPCPYTDPQEIVSYYVERDLAFVESVLGKQTPLSTEFRLTQNQIKAFVQNVTAMIDDTRHRWPAFFNRYHPTRTYVSRVLQFTSDVTARYDTVQQTLSYLITPALFSRRPFQNLPYRFSNGKRNTIRLHQTLPYFSIKKTLVGTREPLLAIKEQGIPAKILLLAADAQTYRQQLAQQDVFTFLQRCLTGTVYLPREIRNGIRTLDYILFHADTDGTPETATLTPGKERRDHPNGIVIETDTERWLKSTKSSRRKVVSNTFAYLSLAHEIRHVLDETLFYAEADELVTPEVRAMLTEWDILKKTGLTYANEATLSLNLRRYHTILDAGPWQRWGFPHTEAGDQTACISLAAQLSTSQLRHIHRVLEQYLQS